MTVPRALFAILFCLWLPACGPSRSPIPPGEIPRQGGLASEDERYGHEVFSALSERYPIDKDDARINRVRDIVDKLTEAAGANGNPWHVHVLVDDNFVNAAATRGNYIFVWTGLLKNVQSDAELATVLSHEIGHVLAGHTTPTPQEETQRIIASGLGMAAREIVLRQGGYYGILAGIAEAGVRSIIEAGIINPEQQRKELEADQIGLFLMADAGLNPEDAVRFWERVRTDPNFSGGYLQFLSSHPSSETRLEALKGSLPGAMVRYRPGAAGAGGQAASSRSAGTSRAVRPPSDPSRSGRFALETWVVQEERTEVLAEPDLGAESKGMLPYGTRVTVRGRFGRYLEIVEPVSGYLISRDLSPE